MTVNAYSQSLRLGTRGSQLARWQAEWVAERLRERGHIVTLVEISTRGDVERVRPVEEIGTRGVFTKEIQRALLTGDVDLGVHSLKDLPTERVDGLLLAAVPPRENPADALVTRAAIHVGIAGHKVLSTEYGVPSCSPHSADSPLAGSLLLAPCSLLTQGAHVGTGSLRRRAQLLHARLDLKIEDVRGNIDTRLRKLDDGEFDALVLAAAGLRRLGVANRIVQMLSFDLMLPAVGQGALAIECRADDVATLAAIAPLDDPVTHAAVLAERALLAHLRGGCMAPVGALGQYRDNQLRLSAVVLAADGSRRLAAENTSASADWSDAEQLGQRVADDLLRQGAAELIDASRSGHVT
jgi:hydroxymethylbilane synthase